MEKFNKNWLTLALFCNGAAIMVLEILGTRIVAPHFGTTLYVWTALIVVTLLALALGYYFGGRVADKKPKWNIFYILFSAASVLFLVIPLVDGFVLSASGKLGLMWGPLVAALFLFFIPLGILGMITPFAVRLNAKEVSRIGQLVGNFYAISTAGSIFGALVTAYLLIPNLKISLILVLTAGLLMIITAIWFIVQKKGINNTFIAMAIFVLLTLLTFNNQPSSALEEVQSFYGLSKVEILSSDLTCITVNNIPQSCFNPDLNGSAWSYAGLLARAVEMVPNPQHVLVIGDGGGLITREILKKNSDIGIETVDIDQKIYDLGAEYLHFEDRPNVTKAVSDGRQYLLASKNTYDVIIIDAFTDTSPVLHLYTREMFELAASKLTVRGALAVNSFGFNKGQGTEVVSSIYQTLKTVFLDVYVSPSGNADQQEREFYNFVHFASDHELERLGRVYDVGVNDKTPVISDDFNQLEYLSLPLSGYLLNLYTSK